jgi:PAS domain S-box-containing protein
MSNLAKKDLSQEDPNSNHNLSLVGKWILHIQSGEVTWSDSMYKIFGLPIGTPVSLESGINSFVESDRKKIVKYVQEAIEYGKSWDEEFKIFQPDGSTRDVRGVGRCMYDGKKIVRLEGTISSIEEKPDFSTKISEVNKINYELNDILNKTSIVSRTDKKGVITYANELFCKISGYKNYELIGSDHRILKSGYHKKEFFQEIWTTLLNGETWTGEIKNKSKRGSYYWVSASISPTFDENNEVDGFISIRRDITKQKKDLEISNKVNNLAIIGESSAQMIHDVMNFLMIIEGNSRILDLSIEEDESFELDKVAHHNKKILSACEKIKKVFKEAKDMMSGAEEYRSNELTSLVKDCLHDFELQIEEFGIDLIFEPHKECFLISNRVQLSRVFNNLIKNSIDSISTLAEKWIKVVVHSYQNTLVITLTDSGSGIPIEVQERMFDSFFTTKGPEKGTGIGLNSCKKIIESHGGTIEYNHNAVNTQFIIKFDTNY